MVRQEAWAIAADLRSGRIGRRPGVGPLRDGGSIGCGGRSKGSWRGGAWDEEVSLVDGYGPVLLVVLGRLDVQVEGDGVDVVICLLHLDEL